MRMETDPVSETLCFLDFRVTDGGEVQKPIDSEGGTYVTNTFAYIIIFY
jgi:hypothetical protein